MTERSKLPDRPAWRSANVSEGSANGVRQQIEAHWAPVMAGIVLIASSWVAVSHASQRITEGDHFRQTETALTTYWMVKEGWQLPYQTPAWGFPWAAPIEFPIYEWLVAGLAGTFGLPLEPVGRLTSFAFLLAFAVPVLMIQRRLRLPVEAAWVFCALVWSSPLYLFWGRTFMIDTAAVFFTLAAIPYLLDLRGPFLPWRSAILASLWGSLGMLQRSITTGPALVVLAVVLLAPRWRIWKEVDIGRRFMRLLIGIGLPILIGVAWTVYSDVVKSHNFVGRELTLQFRLSEKYIGSLTQRLDLSSWKELFWNRMLEENAGGVFGAALIGGVLWSRQRPTSIVVWVCLVLAALPVALFFDVSLFLDYYQVSSTLFLIAAVAISCVMWLPTAVRSPAVAPLAATALVLVNISTFWSRYGSVVSSRPASSTFRGLAIGEVIDRYTPEDSGIVALGIHSGLSSFCPEIPYFARRKGFTVPDWKEPSVHDPAAFLGGKALGALVFCATENKDRYNEWIARYSTTQAPSLFQIAGCHVWLPHTLVVTLTDGTRVLPIRFIE